MLLSITFIGIVVLLLWMRFKIKKEFVHFYAKIYCESFPEYPWGNNLASGKEVFDFLTSDANQQYDENENLIPGDKVIWYLGCNEKFGTIKYKDKEWSWEFGESTFSNVVGVIEYMYQDDFFNASQYKKLMELIEEGKLIDNMYEIGNYLKCKSEGKEWKTPADFRPATKEFFREAKESMEKAGYKWQSNNH